VRLQDELAAQPVLVVDDEDADARAAQLEGGGESGRAAADDEAFRIHRRDIVQAERACGVG
jgi:hypothetical protein